MASKAGKSKSKPRKPRSKTASRQKPGLFRRLFRLLMLFVGLAILGAIIFAWDWPLRASIIVLVLGSIGFVMVMAQLLLDLRGNKPSTKPSELAFEIPSYESSDPATQRNGLLEIWAWLVGLLAAIFLIGLPISLALFVFLYTKSYGGGWAVSLGMAVMRLRHGSTSPQESPSTARATST